MCQEGVFNDDVTLYLLGCGGHVHYILNAVVEEGPGVLEVGGGILDHHQLGGVVDAGERRPLRVPVHLQDQ